MNYQLDPQKNLFYRYIKILSLTHYLKYKYKYKNQNKNMNMQNDRLMKQYEPNQYTAQQHYN